MAMKYHPDRNPDDPAAEKAFKDVNEAYEVLKDDQKRAAYDQFGHEAFESGLGGAQGASGFASGFSDIFDQMFGDITGSRRGARANNRGSDLRYNMSISLDEAFSGKQTEIKVPTAVGCELCSGTGAEEGSKPQVCGTCGGQGRVRAQQGFFTVERTCAACRGAGEVITKPCRPCGGSGRTQKEKNLSVNIPAGVEEGTRIRLSGEGEAGPRNGATGDLYIFLTVEDHPIFRRDGANIYCRVPLEMSVAALGGQIDVPTLGGGRARISIKAGTQTGTQFRLKGKGMSILRSAARGDLYVEAAVETPVSLNKNQKRLLEEFAASTSPKTSPEASGFFAKVKELWSDL
ncbi:MAG: molecular chaperone DnaJ [Rhodospirillaceae bacterium]|nr:molecular chaperone DnaJ [Rhodospirillaceae bacterium]